MAQEASGSTWKVIDDFHQFMLVKLQELNEVVGKTMPEEAYSLTPKEMDYILAGGYQRNFNQLNDARLIEAGVTKPVGFPDKPDDSQLDAIMNKRANAIRAITDDKFRKKKEAEKEQQQRFAELFIYNKKGGNE